MDRVTVIALLVAAASVTVSLIQSNVGSSSAGHAMALVAPLAIIAFPEAIDAGFRNTFQGSAHGGEGPTPATIMRVAAWILLIVVVVVHHIQPLAPHFA